MSDTEISQLKVSILKLLEGIPLRDTKTILEGCILSAQSCSVLQVDYITQLEDSLQKQVLTNSTYLSEKADSYNGPKTTLTSSISNDA